MGRLRQQKIHHSELALNNIEHSINSLPQRLIERHTNKLDVFEKAIAASDPKRILEKGFTITKINGKLASVLPKPEKGDVVETTTKGTTFESVVK